MPLGAGDVGPRILGIRRHQVICSVVGLMFFCDALLLGGGSIGYFATGISFLVMAPIGQRGTVGNRISVLAGYLLRSRIARFKPTGNVYELEHVGRLDLSGGEEVVIRSLQQICATSSLEGNGRTFGLSLQRSSAGSRTLLGGAHLSNPGWPWRQLEPTIEVIETREHWDAISFKGRFVTILSFDDFTYAARQQFMFERFLKWLPSGHIVLKIKVVNSQKGLRVSARASHRLATDLKVSSNLGFRSSVRALANVQRKLQQEQEVEAGATLLQLGAFLVCEAETRAELKVRVAQCLEQSKRCGVPLKVRYGEQRLLLNALTGVVSGA